ncbi:MAG: hypothetical protein Q9186_007662 [Xanthomendoza sp. 1 TL-2023]
MDTNGSTRDGQSLAPLHTLPSTNLELDILDLGEDSTPSLVKDQDGNTNTTATGIEARVGRTFRAQLNELGRRNPASVCRWIHMRQEELDFQQFVGETLALDVAAIEYDGHPQKVDKIRNISRGLTRFRIEHESKGVHGRSFPGAFSQFAEVGQEGMLQVFLAPNPHELKLHAEPETPGFLSLPYLSLDELSKARRRYRQPSTLHLAKTLLQHHFRFDKYALDDDVPARPVKSFKSLMVPSIPPATVFVGELWGLCLDQHILITSSASPAQNFWPRIISTSPQPTVAFKQPLDPPALTPPHSFENALNNYFPEGRLRRLIDETSEHSGLGNRLSSSLQDGSGIRSWVLGRIIAHYLLRRSPERTLGLPQVDDLLFLCNCLHAPITEITDPNTPLEHETIDGGGRSQRSLARLQRRCHQLQGYELSNILSHIHDWRLIEQELKDKGQMISDELTDCLEVLWEDAIHLFLNLETEEGKQKFILPHGFILPDGFILPNWVQLMLSWRQRSILPHWMQLPLSWRQRFAVVIEGDSNLLAFPRRDGETIQDLEQDLRSHLAQLYVERHYLQFHVDVRKKSDLLEDLESTPGNTSRLCLLHAFHRVAPFRSNAEAQNTIQQYSKQVSHMAFSAQHHPSKALLRKILKTCEEMDILKSIIVSQQKAYSRIIDAVDQSLKITKGGKHNHHRSRGHKRRGDASPRIHLARSAWLKTSKMLEEVEQLQTEGKRLAEQVGARLSGPNASFSLGLSLHPHNHVNQMELTISWLTKQTIQLIDIKAEGQGKAVMVFTVVTVIFLPLSFVSSYFGMNTADVRELQQGQWIFWAVGLSVTFSTVVVALLVAFRGQRWKQRWNEKYVRDYEKV